MVPRRTSTPILRNSLHYLHQDTYFCNIRAMKASELILDLLRTYRARGTSVSVLTEAAELFGISENSVRVNLSRLASRGLVEQVQRGQYRLCTVADPVNEFAEGWRLGEARVKPWQENQWICIHLNKADNRSKWVLTNLGFRAVDLGLWIRPANLTEPTSQLFHRLQSLGLQSNVICVDNATPINVPMAAWIEQFDLEALKALYIETTDTLATSLRKLDQLPAPKAKKESFMLGGQGIALLAKDPLIPSQFMSTQYRERLWQVLVEYDRKGREIWANQSQVPEALVAPHSRILNTQVKS